MTRRRSLSGRLILLLLFAQFAAFIIGWFVGVALGLYGVGNFDMSVDELSYARMRAILLSSLRSEDGTPIRIEPDARLRSEIQRSPALLYAVFDYPGWRPIEGSES